MQYRLRVLRAGQVPSNIKLSAPSTEAARLQAEQQGFTVLEVASGASLTRSIYGLRADNFPLILFCQEFRVLLEAGLALPEALDTLIEKETSLSTRAMLMQLLAAVKEGMPLSAAMSFSADANSSAFPSLFVATISAAETSGDLPEALSRYAAYLEQVDLLKKRIISASIYPALVLGFGLLVMVFLMAYVIPRFTRIYESQVTKLSFSTEILLKLGKFSDHYGIYALIVFALAVLASISLLSRSQVRSRLYELLWKLPYFGDKVRIYHLSRFYRTFSMLLKSGIPIMSGLGMVSTLLGAGLQLNLQKARTLIAQGSAFSHAFNESGLTTPVAARLFTVGERTGTLESMMERAASFHEDEMQRWVDRFTKVFEPALMSIIGVIIGGIVLMMYLPIFELATSLD